MKIVILDAAQQDLVEGYRFYEGQEEDLGAYFLDCLYSDIDSLQFYAGVHPIIFRHHRSLSKRFPFGIYYTVTGDTVYINAVLDCRTPLRGSGNASRRSGVPPLYRVDTGKLLAQTTLHIPAGTQQWITWDVNVTATGYLRLDLDKNPDVTWHHATEMVPGHVSAFAMSATKMRRYRGGETLAVRVEPPQPCFPAGNVLSGVTRPHRTTNLWRSATLPACLELHWPKPQMIGQIELTFAGNLFKEFHAYPPLWRDPQCVRDYTIEVANERIEVTGNYHRHRRHAFAQPVTTDKLRIAIQATNGDPTAAIYEVRCYQAARI